MAAPVAVCSRGAVVCTGGNAPVQGPHTGPGCKIQKMAALLPDRDTQRAPIQILTLNEKVQRLMWISCTNIAQSSQAAHLWFRSLHSHSGAEVPPDQLLLWQGPSLAPRIHRHDICSCVPSLCLT